MQYQETFSGTWGRTGAIRLTICAIVLASVVYAHPRISKELDNINPESTVDVIVQFRSNPTEASHRKITDRGGLVKSKLDLVRGGAYRILASKLEDLANDPEVEQIVPDRQLSGLGNVTYGIGSDPALTVTGAATIQAAGNLGSGIGIAVIDSGLTSYGDLTNIVYSQSFVEQGTSSFDSRTADAYGHGTHVAGIIASSGYASRLSAAQFPYWYVGMAPGAQLINLRVLNGSGSGRDSDVIAAIQKAIALKSTYNIRIINLSLGRAVTSSYKVDPLCQAAEAAWKAGIVVVAAAGNYGRDNSFGEHGYGTILAPGNDPYVITVGAMKDMGTPTRTDDLIASYSSKGPTLIDYVVKPDVVAPGNLIVSVEQSTATLPTLYPGNRVNSATNHPEFYLTLSGTSMATPMVSGGIALLLQMNPSLTPDQVKARVMKTASKSFPPAALRSIPQPGPAIRATTTFSLSGQVMSILMLHK